MKAILFFLILLSTIITAQDYADRNPDGERISIHLTPYFITGSFEREFIEPVRGSIEEEITNYNATFNVSLMVKIPVSNTVTIAPFWQTSNYNYDGEVVTEYRFTPQLYYKLSKFGATFSVYF